MLPIRIHGIKRIIKIAHSNWNPGVSVAVYSVGPIPGSEVLENLCRKMLNFDVYRKKFLELFRGVTRQEEIAAARDAPRMGRRGSSSSSSNRGEVVGERTSEINTSGPIEHLCNGEDNGANLGYFVLYAVN